MFKVMFIKQARVHSVTVTQFWDLARANYFDQSDLILDPSVGKFLAAGSYSQLVPYLPIQDPVKELIAGVIKIAAVVAMVGLVVNAFDSPAPAPRRRRRAGPNREPLEAWKKSYVRERDEYWCNYCGRYTENGHVDHKTSRANGGSNRLNNLCWSCPPCNLSKGRRNAREFRRSLQFQ